MRCSHLLLLGLLFLSPFASALADEAEADEGDTITGL